MLDKGNSDQSNKTVMTLKEQKNQANEFVARWKIEGMNDKIHSLLARPFAVSFGVEKAN